MAKIPIALQMYTLRDESAKDYVGTLAKVAKLGYAGVELAGTGGLSATDLAKTLASLGLKVAGSHIGLDQLESNLEAELDFNATIGNAHIVCPWVGEERRKTAADWRTLAASFNRIGDACAKRGMKFCYHNHAFEFEKFDGLAGLDILFGAADPRLVNSELDTYWVKYGGGDPVAYVNRFSGRIPLVHLKDMSADTDRAFAEIGEGTLDIRGIISAAEKAGTTWAIVEQDVCKRPPLESVEISITNLRKMGLA